jgi:hypothetical protein
MRWALLAECDGSNASHRRSAQRIEVLDNPTDPAVMAVRQTHYLAAKAARR